jgi:hypothetical protein
MKMVFALSVLDYAQRRNENRGELCSPFFLAIFPTYANIMWQGHFSSLPICRLRKIVLYFLVDFSFLLFPPEN